MQYPINLVMRGRLAVVIGGGRVALRKIKSLLLAEARVRVIAPEILPKLETLASSGRIEWRRLYYGEMPRPSDEDDLLADAFMLICATDKPEINTRAARAAKERGILINAPAEPELSDFTLPAVLRRGEFTLAVSTGNLSPAFSRVVRRKLERDFPESFGAWLERLAALRQELRQQVQDERERENIWRRALDDNILELVGLGELDQAEVELRHGIDRCRLESQNGSRSGAGTVFTGEGGYTAGTDEPQRLSRNQ